MADEQCGEWKSQNRIEYIHKITMLRRSSSRHDLEICMTKVWRKLRRFVPAVAGTNSIGIKKNWKNNNSHGKIIIQCLNLFIAGKLWCVSLFFAVESIRNPTLASAIAVAKQNHSTVCITQWLTPWGFTTVGCARWIWNEPTNTTQHKQVCLRPGYATQGPSGPSAQEYCCPAACYR